MIKMNLKLFLRIKENFFRRQNKSYYSISMCRKSIESMNQFQQDLHNYYNNFFPNLDISELDDIIVITTPTMYSICFRLIPTSSIIRKDEFSLVWVYTKNTEYKQISINGNIIKTKFNTDHYNEYNGFTTLKRETFYYIEFIFTEEILDEIFNQIWVKTKDYCTFHFNCNQNKFITKNNKFFIIP